MNITLREFQLYQALEKAIRVIIDNPGYEPDWGKVKEILAKIEGEGL